MCYASRPSTNGCAGCVASARPCHIDDGVVSFRIKSGKGVKPAKVSTEEFSEAVELLASTVEAVQQAAGKLAASPSDE